MTMPATAKIPNKPKTAAITNGLQPFLSAGPLLTVGGAIEAIFVSIVGAPTGMLTRP